jgi:hypothetical protein
MDMKITHLKLAKGDDLEITFEGFWPSVHVKIEFDGDAIKITGMMPGREKINIGYPKSRGDWGGGKGF